jgi:hypothetical protein
MKRDVHYGLGSLSAGVSLDWIGIDEIGLDAMGSVRISFEKNTFTGSASDQGRTTETALVGYSKALLWIGNRYPL